MKFTTDQGQIWYLHSKEISWGRGKTTRINFYFKRTQEENSCEMPVGYKVIITRPGMPVLKKV